ncbi:hypothetical protein PFICI_03869 [Pestalotiopsis fici W106-1]|uniref:N-acetyltransferase domain-containing protein n=1 Tax=Pestalotiopsis fici (strain W106-1 / CGMCC3.15140) TaxID=1229662 RepID=W3XIL5_PESFW|nr:uncharacterized protein PFICI_03869 [Pestalotiopsis fici W106-1]ETS85844.1 hypothetical protein PFICI_03869 [Pestalotiopsis fici W106-1]
MEPGKASYIEVETTIPVIEGYPSRIETSRLLIRPLISSDLDNLWSLRRAAAVMNPTGRGRPDSDIEETKEELSALRGPWYNSHLYYGIFLRNRDGVEGDLIGDGGVRQLFDTESGWPEFGYKFKEEYWGNGYATEFAKAFLEVWWGLARQPSKLSIHPALLDHYHSLNAREQLYGWSRVTNKGSEGVLLKLGFRYLCELDNMVPEWRIAYQIQNE